MGAGRWLVSGVGYRLEESLEYRTLVPEALSIWRMAGANRMLFDCFDVDSKAARRSVAILSSCLRIECWGRDVVLRAFEEADKGFVGMGLAAVFVFDNLPQNGFNRALA